MKLTTERPFANPEAAARKLIELAAGIEPTMPGRMYIELINYPMLFRLKASVSVREVVESDESFVIQEMRPDSVRAATDVDSRKPRPL
jgi:hypothetical protein